MQLFQNKYLVVHHHDNTIFKFYDPKNDEDVKRICHDTGIQSFIKDKNTRYPNVILFKTNRYNMGVVTQVFIKKNQIICIYLGEIACLDTETTERRMRSKLLKSLNRKISEKKLNTFIESEIKRVTHYAFEFNARSKKANSVLAHDVRSTAAFINHNGTDPNAKAHIQNNTIYYKAARDIQPGEQLTIDYGPDYDYPEHLYYIPAYENHLSREQFFIKHIKEYHQTPIQLTDEQLALLNIDTAYCMIPEDLYQFLFKNIIPKTFNHRLPILFLEQYKKLKKHHLYFLSQQPNITPLMFAMVIKNNDATEVLIKKCKVDVLAKTSDDMDALILSIKQYRDEKEYLKTYKTLLKNAIHHTDRIELIGIDETGKTALHLLVERGWLKVLKQFNRSIYFDIVDQDGYDAFIYAIAHGKLDALQVLLKLSSVKKSLDGLLFAEDETKNDLVIKRALKNTPKKLLPDVIAIIKKSLKNKPKLLRKFNKLLG